MSTQADEWTHHTYQPGSALYYSLYFLPTETRNALIPLHALFKAWQDVLYECHDSGVAQVKLEWWLTELEQMLAGVPVHPVTQALQPFVHTHQLSATHLQQMLEGHAAFLTQKRFDTAAELAQHCHTTFGTMSVLCSQIMGYQQPETMQYAERLGVALGLAQLFRQLRRDLLQGRITLPLADLAQFQVKEHALFEGQHSAELRALLQHHLHTIHAQFHYALSALSPVDCAAQRGGLIRAHLMWVTLQEIAHDDYQLLTHGIRLTPIRKLWLAWLTQWRAKRGKAPSWNNV